MCEDLGREVRVLKLGERSESVKAWGIELIGRYNMYNNGPKMTIFNCEFHNKNRLNHGTTLFQKYKFHQDRTFYLQLSQSGQRSVAKMSTEGILDPSLRRKKITSKPV